MFDTTISHRTIQSPFLSTSPDALPTLPGVAGVARRGPAVPGGGFALCTPRLVTRGVLFPIVVSGPAWGLLCES